MSVAYFLRKSQFKRKMSRKNPEEIYFRELRRYKTLSSINRAPEFNIFKNFIEFSDFLYEKGEKNEVDEVFEKIREIFTTNDTEISTLSLRYFSIYSFLNFCKIRIKNLEFSEKLFNRIVTELPEQKNFITKIYLDEQKNLIRKIYMVKNEDLQIFNFLSYKDDSITFNSQFITYPKDSLEYLLFNDDVESFKKYITTNSNFDPNKSVEIIQLKNSKDRSSFNHRMMLFMENPINFEDVSILDFCAFYGSQESFKFLVNNYCKINDSNVKYAIDGGCLEIIHIVEQEGISFDNQFYRSIINHRLHISEWLLSNYKCEVFSFWDCAKEFDFRSFLFLFLNGYKSNLRSLQQLWENNLYIFGEAIKLLISNEAIKTVSSIKSQRYIEGEIHLLSSLCHSESDYDISDLLKLFIKNGEDVNIPEYHSGSFEDYHYPLDLLCSHVHLNKNAIKILIDNGAKTNKALHILCQSRGESEVDLIKTCIDKCSNINHLKDNTTALAKLCQNESVPIQLVEYFIEKGADVNKGSVTPLYYVCKHYSIDINLIKLLLQSGADIFKECSEFSSNDTPFEVLFKESNLNYEVINIFIETIPENEKSQKLGNLLLKLCTYDDLSIDSIEFLIKQGANIKEGDFLYKLCYFHKNLNIEFIELFINNGAQMITDGIEGYQLSPLHALCQRPHLNLKLIQYFLIKGLNPNEFYYQPNELLTPLSIILTGKPEKNCFEAVSLLLQYGADPSAGFQIDSSKGNIFPFICQNDYFNIKIFNLLIEKGAGVNSLYNDKTPLYLLLSHPNPNIDTIKLLLEKGANSNKGSNNSGNIITPLYKACSNTPTNIEIIKLLLSYGADVNKPSLIMGNPRPPLFMLCKKTILNLDAIQLLLEKGADPNKEIPDETNTTTPFYELCSNRIVNKATFSLMVKYGAKIDDHIKSISKDNPNLSVILNNLEPNNI